MAKHTHIFPMISSNGMILCLEAYSGSLIHALWNHIALRNRCISSSTLYTCSAVRRPCSPSNSISLIIFSAKLCCCSEKFTIRIPTHWLKSLHRSGCGQHDRSTCPWTAWTMRGVVVVLLLLLLLLLLVLLLLDVVVLSICIPLSCGSGCTVAWSTISSMMYLLP